MSKQLEENIKHIVSKIAHVSPKKLDNNADLFKDFGVDSLKALEIIVSIEKKYKIKVALKKMAKIRTIAHIIEIVENAKKN